MPWTIGADVVVRSFGGKRGTVVDVGHDGRYRVRVDTVTLWCREDQLTDPPAFAKGLRRGRPVLSRTAARRARASRDANRQHAEEPANSNASARLDLHGLSVDEAMARVMTEIDRALQRGAGRLEVIHGKGSGRIKAALHRLLQSLPVVASFELDDNNPGVTWVRF